MKFPETFSGNLKWNFRKLFPGNLFRKLKLKFFPQTFFPENVFPKNLKWNLRRVVWKQYPTFKSFARSADSICPTRKLHSLHELRGQESACWALSWPRSSCLLLHGLRGQESLCWTRRPCNLRKNKLSYTGYSFHRYTCGICRPCRRKVDEKHRFLSCRVTYTAYKRWPQNVTPKI